MLRDKITRNNTSISYIIIRQHLYDNEDEVEITMTIAMTITITTTIKMTLTVMTMMMVMMTIIIITFPLFMHACTINSTKASGTEKNPNWSETS